MFFVVFVHCLWHLNACDYMVSMRSEHWRKKLSFTVVNVKIILNFVHGMFCNFPSALCKALEIAVRCLEFCCLLFEF